MKTCALLSLFLIVVAVSTSRLPEDRIVGGSDASYGSHPYICSLQYLNPSGSGHEHKCGAVVWNHNYLVTAAHCIQGLAKYYKAICGVHHLHLHDKHQVERDVIKVRKHPLYVGNLEPAIPYDIGVVRLSEPLVFDTHVHSVPLASEGSFLNQSCSLLGWGKVAGDGPISNTLLSVNLTKISNADCQARYSWMDVEDYHICFHTGPGEAACNGDSGGPVVCGDDVVGVTSWGMTSCTGEWPSVYSRVSYFYPWIVSEAGPQ